MYHEHSDYSLYKDQIITFYRTRKRMPSYQEIAQLLGFKSKNAAYKVVQKLIEEGVVRKDKQGTLVPEKVFSEVPMLGLVTAGFPRVSEEELRDTLNLEDFLVEKKETTYLLEVDGDSMIDAHIAPGDIVIVERTHRAHDGDIIIAEIDGEWTMKYLRQKNGISWLEPANKKYKPIYPTEDLKIAAVVKGVIRKY